MCRACRGPADGNVGAGVSRQLATRLVLAAPGGPTAGGAMPVAGLIEQIEQPLPRYRTGQARAGELGELQPGLRHLLPRIGNENPTRQFEFAIDVGMPG